MKKYFNLLNIYIILMNMHFIKKLEFVFEKKTYILFLNIFPNFEFFMYFYSFYLMQYCLIGLNYRKIAI